LETATSVRQRTYSLARHRRKAAGLIAKIDDLAELGARSHPAGRQAVHFDEAVVADDQRVVGIEEAQALRHVVDRGVELEVARPQRLFLLPEQLILLLEARMQRFALGDVFMGGDAAAVGHRPDRVGDDAAVGEFLHGGVERDVAADPLADVIFRRHPHLEAELEAVTDQVAGQRARLHLFRREPVHLHVALVAEQHFALVIEDDDAERQIVDCVLDQRARIGRRSFSLIQFRHGVSPSAHARGNSFCEEVSH
jgi:hypothetical protein